LNRQDKADICGALYDVRFQELSGTRVSYVRQMATLSALIKKRTSASHGSSLGFWHYSF